MSERRGLRSTGILLIVVLISTAVVMFLREREVTVATRNVSRVAESLREEGVEAAELDQREARRMLARLQRMADGGAALSTDELAAAAARAAAWAEGAPTPSASLTVAVALRAAANDLRNFVLLGDPRHTASARRHLERARSALGGSAGGSSVQGVRDRMENLQEAERERFQELDEALQ